MPYIKSISIRNSVAGCLKYIANPEKTQDGILVSGINCSENIEIAEKEMCLTYQNYSHKNFYAKPLSDKSPVKAFHFVQSFKGDECDAELAHKIGMEWIRKAFGENFQAIITTHTDTGNIHNHICLCPYDLLGKKFNSNKKSLAYVRKTSDELCRSYGIGEMEKLMSDENYIPVGVVYGEWKHKKQGTSWKEIIRNKIDMLIASAKSFDELLGELEQQDYTIKYGKYISVKAPNQQRAVRLKTLGADYSEENIARRIREYLDSLPKTKTVSEIISEIMEQFKYQTRKFSFAKSVNDKISVLANQLTVINTEGITSISQAEDKLTEIQQLAKDTQSQLDELSEQKKSAENIISAAERYFKKYGVFEKGRQYPKLKQQADKALLAEFGIKKLDDIFEFKENVQGYSNKITALQNTLSDVKSKAESYRSIIDTYKYSVADDYISRLVKAARDKMDEQERVKLKNLESETYEIYYPNDRNFIPYKEQTTLPNVDNYYNAGCGNWIDADGDDIGMKLENVYRDNSLSIGTVILVKTQAEQKAYYVDEIGFKPMPNFTKSHSEQQKKLQEEKQNQTAVKKKSHGR